MLTKEMIILDIVEKYPETEEVFRSYDDYAGKCTMCYNLFDSLEDFSLEYKIDLNDLMIKLNEKIL